MRSNELNNASAMFLALASLATWEGTHTTQSFRVILGHTQSSQFGTVVNPC